LPERHSVLLLDMNGVFMFGQDRFGRGEDSYSTYRSMGGTRLSSADVTNAIRSCFTGMMQDYENPARFDRAAEVLFIALGIRLAVTR